MQWQSQTKFPDHHKQKQISQSGKPTLTHYVQAIFCTHKQTTLMAMLNAITKNEHSVQYFIKERKI